VRSTQEENWVARTRFAAGRSLAGHDSFKASDGL
jgi:hypothetical protein